MGSSDPQFSRRQLLIAGAGALGGALLPASFAHAQGAARITTTDLGGGLKVLQGGGCNVLDVSAYDGISFIISGNVAMGNALTMNVGVSADQVSHVWLNRVSLPPPATPAGINAGRCIPANNQYDGTCSSPAFSVPVTAQPTTVTVLWSQLTGGSPAASVDPREIVGISWSFPTPPGAGDPVNAMPYPMDIVIDNISFVDNP